MARLVVFFAVMRCGCAVGVRGKLMELRRSLMRLVWHGVFLSVQVALIPPFALLTCEHAHQEPPYDWKAHL